MNTGKHREQVHLAVDESTCGEGMVLPNLDSSHCLRHILSPHSDVWNCNMLFKYADNNEITFAWS